MAQTIAFCLHHPHSFNFLADILFLNNHQSVSNFASLRVAQFESSVCKLRIAVHSINSAVLLSSASGYVIDTGATCNLTSAVKLCHSGCYR